jgi:hypothetical protein
MPASMVRLICPNLKCRAILSVPTTARGKTVRCRQCGIRVTVPPPKEPALVAAPPPEPPEPPKGPKSPKSAAPGA